jgi:hypothetical protein
LPELRVILLVAGVVLIGGLFAWERRKGGTQKRSAETVAPPPAAVTTMEGAMPPMQSAAAPQLSIPVRATRELAQDLPVIQVSDGVDIDLSFAAPPPEPAVPVHVELTAEIEAIQYDGDGVGPTVERSADAVAWQAPAEEAVTSGDLVLDWPPEAERQIVALRVVPRAAERFAGRSVRQALVGEGFLHGPMDIFHLPREDGRVLLSAAGLTRPGIFRLDAMDTERFAGINVFAVLPGALPPEDTFDRLIEVARSLASRLNAELRDQRGEPLTTARVVAMRAQCAGSGP